MTTLSALTTAQRTGLQTALLDPIAPFLAIMKEGDASVTLSSAIEVFMGSDEFMTPFLAHAEGIDFAAALSDDERARVVAAVKTAIVEAMREGQTGSVAAALSAEQHAAIVRAITTAVAPRVRKSDPTTTTIAMEMMIQEMMCDDNEMQAFLDAIDGIDLTAMSEDDERRVKAAAKAMVLEEDEQGDDDEEEEANNATDEKAPATLSDTQRTALINVLSDATLPFMPTLYGNPAASAREKALEIAYDVELLQRFVPLAKTMDFTHMTEDDKRRIALVVKKIMLKLPEHDDIYKGSPAAAMSETERVAVARVFRKAMPPTLAYMVPGLPAIGGELIVDGFMSDADMMQQFLEANTDIDFAALTEEDELRAVATTTKLLVKDDAKTELEAPPTVEADKEKEAEEANDGDWSDDDDGPVITGIDIKGVDADGNLRGAVAATLSDDERTAIKRVITKAKPSSMFYSVPSKLMHLPFEEIMMASDEDLQKFLDATKGLTLTNLSEEDEARAVAFAKYAFFGDDEPEQEAEEQQEETVEEAKPVGALAVVAAMSETERAVLIKLLARGIRAFDASAREADCVEMADKLLGNRPFVKAFLDENKGITFSDELTEAEQERVVDSVGDVVRYADSDDE